MYRYNEQDRQLLQQRTAQFRQQVQRRLAGQLSEEEFRPLRLMNGLYVQRQAPMLRIAVPYGLLSAPQLRTLARIARDYDRGYGHFTTRQNLQFNWLPLEIVPEVLAHLAEVDMHAIQTSGNCIRNVTADPLAGVAEDEIIDPRPYCEIIRQWSTLHPEFTFLPRKFKIAVTGAKHDRAAIKVHDIGLQVRYNDEGALGFRVYVGGGLGRTPHIGHCLREFLPEADLLSYLEAVLRVYNEWGRRDNLYKARIKILVKQTGMDDFSAAVEREWDLLKASSLQLTSEQVADMQQFFQAPAYDASAADDSSFQQQYQSNPLFAQWVNSVVLPHRVAGYKAVMIPLKNADTASGDITAEQLDGVADLCEQYSFGEVRATHEQNLLLADVRQGDLFALWQALRPLKLVTPVFGTLHDLICCPGLDFCSLANAHSIPLAQAIQQHFAELDYLYDLGELQLNISGCMNACGHHHVGHIGILGVDKKGQSFYQVMLGGEANEDAQLGENIGPALDQAGVIKALEQILSLYLAQREQDERFIDTFRRLGIKPFKERVYGSH